MWTSQSETDIVKSEFQLCYFEDTEVVIKMITKGRSPTMRRVSRTHRSALDWLFDRINLEPEMQMTYVDTKNQLADMLTKGSFKPDEWNHLLRMFNMRSFSMFSCSHFRNFLSDPIGKQSAMSKRSESDFQWRFSDGETKTNGSSEDKIRQLGVAQSMEREGKSCAGLGGRGWMPPKDKVVKMVQGN